MAKFFTGVNLKLVLLTALICGFSSAQAQDLEGGVSQSVNSSEGENLPDAEGMDLEIPLELFYQLWPGYVDSLIKVMSTESIENSPLVESANFGRSLKAEQLESVTRVSDALISASDQAGQSNLVTAASDQVTYQNGLNLITSPTGAFDDSYIISASGTRMLDAISVCAAPALNVAFTSLPDCGCSVRPIEAAERVSITEGTALIVADRDMEIAVNVGKLKIAEGSVVLVSTTATGTAVFDFHDPGKNSVVLLTASGRSLAISPGRHLHATSEKTSDFAAVNSLDRIAHRRVTCATTDGGTVFTSEFSTLSAMEAVEPLKKVLTLKHPEARKLANQMLKTSAVLLQLGGSNTEDFKHHFKPKMTALVEGASVSN